MNRMLPVLGIVIAVVLVNALLPSLTSAQESIPLVNPSFEDQTFIDDPNDEFDLPPFDGTLFDEWPGYANNASFPGNPTEITGWAYTGAASHGVNNNVHGFPFADNGLIPDAVSVAFMQAPGALTQNITGLDTSKQYWLQFYVNARHTSGGEPGDAGIPNGRVVFDGAEIVPASPVVAIEEAGSRTIDWYFINVPFSPAVASGDLTFEMTSVDPSPVGGGTDAALVIDAVSIIERDTDQIVIQNPSFEASGQGVRWPGYQNVAGWTATGPGPAGINPANDDGDPFADNGIIPEGRNVGFLQNENAFTQTINGLVAGEEYEISYFYNARNFIEGADTDGLPDSHIVTTLGTETLHDADVAPVEAPGTHTLPFHSFSTTFTAADTSALLSIANTQEFSSLVFDNVKIRMIASAFLEGDFNEDGSVDGDDFLAWQTGFNQFNGDATKMDGDANGDGFVNGDDFLIWQGQFGSADGNASAAVPEPSTAFLALLVALCSLGLCRKRRTP